MYKIKEEKKELEKITIRIPKDLLNEFRYAANINSISLQSVIIEMLTYANDTICL